MCDLKFFNSQYESKKRQEVCLLTTAASEEETKKNKGYFSLEKLPNAF